MSMQQLISRFTEQLEEAMAIGSNLQIMPWTAGIRNIYVAGIGGSGIGADFVSSFIKSSCQLPFSVGKGYHIPEFIGEHTLALVSSYSGNTEETLSAFHQLLKTGCKIVVISSGGKLIDLAKQHDLDYAQVPSGWPSPRACLGYSIVQQLYILRKLDLIPEDLIQSISTARELIMQETDDIKLKAKEIAELLYEKTPVIYATDRMEPVAVRFRQQINENSKMLCWHHVVPEMNHNELVGWRSKNAKLVVLYLLNEDDFDRNQMRIKINKEIISKYCDTIIDIRSKGANLVEKSFYLVHLVDWISVYLADLNGVDAIEIGVIDYLKKELAKV